LVTESDHIQFIIITLNKVRERMYHKKYVQPRLIAAIGLYIQCVTFQSDYEVMSEKTYIYMFYSLVTIPECYVSEK